MTNRNMVGKDAPACGRCAGRDHGEPEVRRQRGEGPPAVLVLWHQPASKSFCHRFVHIPVQHCLNLATAVSTVLYDWQHKEVTRYGKPEFTLDEERGPVTEERNCFA